MTNKTTKTKEAQKQALERVKNLINISLKSAHELENEYEGKGSEFQKGYFYANARTLEDVLASIEIVENNL